MAFSMKQYLESVGYPSDSRPEPNSVAGGGTPSFFVAPDNAAINGNGANGGLPEGNAQPVPNAFPTSADSVPQPDVDLPPHARSNELADNSIGAYDALAQRAEGYRPGPADGYLPTPFQFEFSTDPVTGLLSAQAVEQKTQPGANPYPFSKSGNEPSGSK